MRITGYCWHGGTRGLAGVCEMHSGCALLGAGVCTGSQCLVSGRGGWQLRADGSWAMCAWSERSDLIEPERAGEGANEAAGEMTKAALSTRYASTRQTPTDSAVPQGSRAAAPGLPLPALADVRR